MSDYTEEENDAYFKGRDEGYKDATDRIHSLEAQVAEYHEANQKRHFRIVELEAQLKEKQIIIDDLCDKWEEANNRWRNAEDDNIKLNEKIVEYRSQNARLKEALKPFAEGWRNTFELLAEKYGASMDIAVKDCDRAKQALQQLSNQGDVR